MEPDVPPELMVPEIVRQRIQQLSQSLQKFKDQHADRSDDIEPYVRYAENHLQKAREFTDSKDLNNAFLELNRACLCAGAAAHEVAKREDFNKLIDTLLNR